ncbi:MAG: hypothetical protein R3F20_14535 [Planctomycetota bacterium]
MSLEPRLLAELLRLIDATAPEEIDCDEFLARVGTLVEARRAAGRLLESAATLWQHLMVCPECREEFETLLAILDEAE